MILENIEIENYKGISKLNFNPLKINVLVGKNNTGKTSILEAINLLFFNEEVRIKSMASYFNMYSKERVINISANVDNKLIKMEIKEASETEVVSIFIKTLINNFLEKLGDEKNSSVNIIEELEKIAINYIDLSLKEYLVKNSLVIIKEGEKKLFQYTFDYYYISRVDEMLKGFVKYFEKISPEENKKDFLIKLKKAADETLFLQRSIHYKLQKSKSFPKNVVYIKNLSDVLHDAFQRRQPEDAEHLHKIKEIAKKHHLINNLESIDFDNVLFNTSGGVKAHSFNFMGDGFIAIIGLLWQLTSENMNNSVILLDEPENHMHPGYIKELIKFIIDSSEKFNIQFFITTHNCDVLDLFLSDNFEPNQLSFIKKEFNLLKMGKAKDSITMAQCLDYNQSLETKNDLLLDLRGA